MLAHLLDIEDEISRRTDDRVLLERMLGLRSGRAGGLAAPLGINQDPLRIPRLPSPARLHEILNTAPEEELEFVRRLAHLLVVWMPLLMPGLVDDYGAKADAFLSVMSALGAEQGPQFHAFAVLAFLVGIHAQTPSVDELRNQLQTFTPAAINIELLASLPTERRTDAFNSLPPTDQRHIAEAVRTRRVAAANTRSAPRFRESAG